MLSIQQRLCGDFDNAMPQCYHRLMIKDIYRGLIDIIFPRNCLLCRHYHPDTAHDPLCPSCRDALPWNKPPFCVRCSRHLEALTEESLCPSCRAHPPHFDESWALLRYEAGGSELLRRFKFRDKTSIRHTFAALLKNFMARYTLQFPQAAMIIPMPLHAARLRERGYDQAALLGACAASVLHIPLRTDILRRQRHTRRQSGLPAKDRWTNIQGAFTINPVLTADIVGREIILVDDVLTTGATASEAAKTLKDAGASRVIVITLAIASCASYATTS